MLEFLIFDFESHSNYQLQTALPITKFNYGFMYLNKSKASVLIGPLECKGKSKATEGGGSCASLKLQGKPTGYYILDTNNGTSHTVETSK